MVYVSSAVRRDVSHYSCRCSKHSYNFGTGPHSTTGTDTWETRGDLNQLRHIPGCLVWSCIGPPVPKYDMHRLFTSSCKTPRGLTCKEWFPGCGGRCSLARNTTCCTYPTGALVWWCCSVRGYTVFLPFPIFLTSCSSEEITFIRTVINSFSLLSNNENLLAGSVIY